MRMLIRKLKQGDIPQVLKICSDVHRYHEKILNGYFKPQNDDFERSAFLESLTDQQTIALVAESENKVLGYLLATITDVVYLIDSKVANISNFGVSQNHRRQKIGSHLMDAFLQICKERQVDSIQLGVYVQNKTACLFYEKYGFTPLSQRMTLKIPK